MPNDAGEPATPIPTENDLSKPEVRLTDEIAPDLSSPPPSLESTPTYVPPKNLERSETLSYDGTTQPIPEVIDTEVSPRTVASTRDSSEVKPVPRSEAEIPHTSAGQPTPATLPTAVSKPLPIVTILLLLISVVATAATYFFFQQNQTLNRQLTEINQTLQQQKIKDGQPTVTPQAKPDLALPDTSTISATISSTPTDSATPSATPTVTNLPGKAFDQMDVVMALASQKYPSAQLLMITASAAESAPTTIIKYWFRQDQTTKRYLYVLKELGKQPSLVDQQVYVTPDNNIPSLNPQATADTLGIDLDEAITLATATCPTTISCIANPITALFVTKDGITRWQITYKPADGSKPYVVQIDSTTKAILFKSQ